MTVYAKLETPPSSYFLHSHTQSAHLPSSTSAPFSHSSAPMSSSPAFSVTPPPPSNPRRRARLLVEARRRGWLTAPHARHVVEVTLDAFKAGKLSPVHPLELSPDSSPSKPSTVQQQQSICTRLSDALDQVVSSDNQRESIHLHLYRDEQSESESESEGESEGWRESGSESESESESEGGAEEDKGSEEGGNPQSSASYDLSKRFASLHLPVSTPPRTHNSTTSSFQTPIHHQSHSGYQSSTPSITPNSSYISPSKKHTSPAATHLKGASSWLCEGSFAHTRQVSAARLLQYFDHHVLSGKLLPNPPSGTHRVSVTWSNRLYKTAGLTYMKRRVGSGERSAAIHLSLKVVDEPVRLYNTLAHEICHAAAWIFDECAKPPHGPMFKAWARRFARWDPSLIITTCHDYAIRYKFNYDCLHCGQSYGRHSKSINTTTKVCGCCRGSLRLRVA